MISLLRHTLGVMVAAAAVALCGCERRPTASDDAIMTCERFTVYADSLVSERISVIAHGDSITFVTPRSRRTVALDDKMKAGVYLTGSDTLINYLFNRHLTNPRLNYNPLTPYEIYLTEAFLRPSDAMATLSDRIAGNEIERPEQAAYGFPIVASDAAWALASREVWLATGNHRWLATSSKLMQNLIDTDRRYCYDSSTGLFTGVTADYPIELLPADFNEADIAAIRSLQANTDRFTALTYIIEARRIAGEPSERYAAMRDSLAEAIETMLWMPEKSRFSEMLYQMPYALQSPVSDNFGQALAIVTGVASPAASTYAVSRTPMSTSGVELRVPVIRSGEHDRYRSALTAAYWAVASARVANQRGVCHALGHLCYMAATDPYAAMALRGAVMRAIYGISLTDNGLTIQPFIPTALGEEHSIIGLEYRDATLDIHISGHGDVISTFAIDDRVTQPGFIPAELTGHHTVRINLSGFSSSQADINIVDPLPMLLATPMVEAEGTDLSITSHDAEAWMVYTDGVQLERIDKPHYQLIDTALTTFVSIAAYADRSVASTASGPLIYVPPADSISIAATETAPAGSRVFRDKQLAKQFVESRRYHNPNITFTVTSDRDRQAWMVLEYVNGLGIVNPGLRYSLRTLSVNSSEPTLLVLPQLSPDSWRHDIDWWRRMGRSVPVAATLREGDNTVSINYFMPGDGGDDDSNILIPTRLIVIYQ